MTTLMDVLKDETNPAIIFGHIHRRAKDFSRTLTRHLGACVEYSRASNEELLDLVTIRTFEDNLRSGYRLATDDERGAHVSASLGLQQTCLNAGLLQAAITAAYALGLTLSRHCIFGAGTEGYHVYYGINPLDLDVPEAA